MKVIISNTSDCPLYQQIKNQIKNAILREELKQGDLLPSIRTFANELKVSIFTIRRVYTELEEEGFITSQVGIGTFVSVKNPESLKGFKHRLVIKKIQELIDTSKALNINKEELIEVINRLYKDT